MHSDSIHLLSGLIGNKEESQMTISYKAKAKSSLHISIILGGVDGRSSFFSVTKAGRKIDVSSCHMYGALLLTLEL